MFEREPSLILPGLPTMHEQSASLIGDQIVLVEETSDHSAVVHVPDAAPRGDWLTAAAGLEVIDGDVEEDASVVVAVCGDLDDPLTAETMKAFLLRRRTDVRNERGRFIEEPSIYEVIGDGFSQETAEEAYLIWKEVQGNQKRLWERRPQRMAQDADRELVPRQVSLTINDQGILGLIVSNYGPVDKRSIDSFRNRLRRPAPLSDIDLTVAAGLGRSTARGEARAHAIEAFLGAVAGPESGLADPAIRDEIINALGENGRGLKLISYQASERSLETYVEPATNGRTRRTRRVARRQGVAQVYKIVPENLAA